MNRKTFPFSKLLLAGRLTSSWSLPLGPPVCPFFDQGGELGGVGGQGKEELVFVIPLGEELLEQLPVSWLELPLRMP